MELLTEQPLSLQGSLKGNASMEAATSTVQTLFKEHAYYQSNVNFKMRDQPSPPGWTFVQAPPRKLLSIARKT